VASDRAAAEQQDARSSRELRLGPLGRSPEDRRAAQRAAAGAAGAASVCLQVNVSGENTKSGLAPDEVAAVATCGRGVPAPQVARPDGDPEPVEGADLEAQRRPHRALRCCSMRCAVEGLALDTISTG
jgi:hypothetical protein